MTRRCSILEEADREIEEQVAYYAAHAGATVARRFYETLKDTFQCLLESPGRGRLLGTWNQELVDIRVWFVKEFPFLVYHREVGGSIEIVHVLHGARDRDAILRGG